MNRLGIGLSLAVAIAAGLSGQQAQAHYKERVLHSFDGSDGNRIEAGLLYVNGTVYGTAYYGGANLAGSVFALDTKTRTIKVLYSFCNQTNCPDGEYPTTFSGLIDVNGTLYGTTYSGGANAMGTVFSLDTQTGDEKVLYSFCQQNNCTDGANPYAGLLYLNGTLYGTTYYGGDNSVGSVFALDPGTGTETVLHSFGSGADGRYAYAGLIDSKGTLYGTTTNGGANGAGTVFSLNPKTGAEKVVYSFCSRKKCTDGSLPRSGLIDVNGTLYGTTVLGGASVTNLICDPEGCGTVFSLDPGTGTETVLYSFCAQTGCADGTEPYSGLIEVQGVLYGTTEYGGSADNGTAYSAHSSLGSERVLHSFCSRLDCADGVYPYAPLIDVNGKLYGTTQGGGASYGGTVFALVRR